MVKSCSAVNCQNRFDKDLKLSFHTLPKDEERRRQWIAFLDRKSLPKVVYICGDHFITGRKSDDKNYPDYVPTISKEPKKVSKTKLKTLSSLKRLERHEKLRTMRMLGDNEKQKVKDSGEESGKVLEVGESVEIVSDLDRIKQLEDSFKKQSEQLKKTKTINAMLRRRNRVLRVKNFENQKKIKELNEKLKEVTCKMDEISFKSTSNEKKMIFYTGLPSIEAFNIVYDLLKDHIVRDEKRIHKLTKKQELVLVLMRLRLSSLEEDLAFRFGVSQSTVARIFHKWIRVMATRLSFLVHWPDREQLLKTMPSCFQDNFKQCVVILDCFEIFIEKPTDLIARAQTYSSYKSHNTVKVLVGITPQGTISYISKPWGGRTSDVYLTENCEILKNLIPGDVVMADRGFTIGDSVGLYCAELKIPEFTRGKSQLQKIEVDGTRDLASVRIHVERVIGLLRNKFTILQKTLPIKMLMLKDDGTCSLTEMLTVCSALCNINPSIVPMD